MLASSSRGGVVSRIFRTSNESSSTGALVVTSVASHKKRRQRQFLLLGRMLQQALSTNNVTLHVKENIGMFSLLASNR
jgi:hypothetical protein